MCSGGKCDTSDERSTHTHTTLQKIQCKARQPITKLGVTFEEKKIFKKETKNRLKKMEKKKKKKEKINK